MKVEEANKIKDWIIKECKKSPEYKKLTSRAFCDHAGYSKYKEVATEIATQLITIPQAVQLNKTLDPTWGACTYAFWQATLSPNFPVYALTKELMEGFINSQPPSQLWGLKMPFDRALIMLPQNTLISPDGYSLNWLLINFLEPFHDCTFAHF
ncbi:hypothetical protein HW132_02030 [Brasilonema sp. CT11]|nr:hypothetical protein [Brasilonema sp. CT11]